MADQTFNVNCGFFDAVNNDRTYTANDMNKPYKRIIANGVFATPQGTPSTDLLVQSAGNGMIIKVLAGAGLFADKWFENPSAISITVPNNTSILPRRDSVIVQVDTRTQGRTGNIVYRTGTPASSPSAPSINTVSGVTEYRLANVYVASNANAINNDAIVDLRGSSSCPWVTSLIQQVDTSTLYQQWQTAYQNYFNESTADWENYENQRREEWEQFFADLTQDLTLSTNVIMLTSQYTTTATTTTIPVNIASYNPDTDILQVFINGLMAPSGAKYSYNRTNNSITLVNALQSGQTVNFVVFKSIITGDISSVQTLIQSLEDRIAQLHQDSGWINFTLESGASAYSNDYKPAVRCIGDRVYLRGSFKGVTSLGSTICTLPVAYRPAQNHIFTTAAVSGTTVQDTVTMIVQTNGSIKLAASSGSLSSTAMIGMCTNFPLN